MATLAADDARTYLRAGALLLLFVFLLNANVLDAFFVGDDFDFLDRTRRMDSWGDAARLEFWGEWEPSWYLTWYADFLVWGYRPLGYHLTNVLCLAAAVIALYWLLRRTWPDAHQSAWAAALLFATHPLHDEAVTYLAARGHVMSVALALLAMCLYTAGRCGESSRGKRAVLLAGAGLLCFAAALAKETALVLPVWIALLEWLVILGERPAARRLKAGLLAGLAFLVPALATMGLRYFVAGLDSEKLTADPGTILEGLLGHAPDYALIGALPLPFAFMDTPAVEVMRPLGWLLIAAALVVCGMAFFSRARSTRPSPPQGLLVLGLAIAASSLGPVFWADLPLRRRYVFTPSVGLVLIAVVVLYWLSTRWPRFTKGLLVLLVLAGAAGTVYRNELYRHSGNVARNLIETVRRAPLGQNAEWPTGRPPRVVLVNLPARYGGDRLSGVYLYHHTDLGSAFRIFDVKQSRIEYAMKFYHAQDLTAEVTPLNRTEMGAVFTFRTRRAFRKAFVDEPAESRRGRDVVAVRESVDPESRSMTYRLRVNPAFWRPGNELYLYSDGGFTRVAAPEPGRP